MATSASGILGSLRILVDADTSKAQATLRKLGGSAGVIGGAIGASAGLAGVAALRMGDSYDQAWDAIRVGTGATGDALAGLGGDFRAVAGRVTDDVGTIGQVLADLNTRTGQTGEGLRDLTENVLDVSRLTGTDAAGNVANLTRLYGDWSIAAADQIATNDKLLRTAQATGVQFDTLAQQVVAYGAPMRALNITFDEGIAMLGKWEKEGVNVETVLTGLRMAVARFAAQGVDPREGFPALIADIKEMDDATGLLAAKQIVGQRAANDFFRAVKEGRFDIEGLMDTIINGQDTVKGLADETRDAGDVFRELGNIITTHLGSITMPLAGIAESMGNLIFLVPAITGALGNALGRAWTKVGGSAAVKGAIILAGKAAGAIYAAAVVVVEKLVSLLAGAWVAMGKPGSAVIAKATAAGAAAGMAYAGAAGAGGFIGTIVAAAARMAPIAIPFVLVEALDQLTGAGTPWENVAEKVQNEAGEQFYRIGAGPFALHLRRGGEEAGEALTEGVKEGMSHPGTIINWGSWAKSINAGWQAIGRAAHANIAGVVSSISTGWQAMGERIGTFGRAMQGTIAVPVQQEFANAVAAARIGVGNLKAALANPPQLMSREDRIAALEKRQRKITKNLNRAVKIDDPINVPYWQRAQLQAQRRLNQLRDGNAKTTGAIAGAHKKMGGKVDQAWRGTEASAKRSTANAKNTATSAARATASSVASTFTSMNSSAVAWGAGLVQSWAIGMLSAAATVRSAAQVLSSMFAAYFEPGSPPKVGPLSTVDKWGPGLVDAWLGPLQRQEGRVANVGARLAGALAPGAAQGRLVAARAGGGAGNTYNIGTLVADESGIDALERRMTRRRRLRGRGTNHYNDAD